MSAWGDLSRLPELRWEPDTPLWRIHRRDRSPIFYGTNLYRFDPPTAASPWGTCYTAPSQLAAYLEVFASLGRLTPALIAERQLAELFTVDTLRLADISDRRVIGMYGLDASYSMGRAYDTSQRLAVDLFDAGFDGIHYPARHDPSGALRSIAVFGPAGNTAARLRVVKDDDIDDLLVNNAADHFHLIPIDDAPLP